MNDNEDDENFGAELDRQLYEAAAVNDNERTDQPFAIKRREPLDQLFYVTSHSPDRCILSPSHKLVLEAWLTEHDVGVAAAATRKATEADADAAAYEFYADPANREPGPGPAIRRATCDFARPGTHGDLAVPRCYLQPGHEGDHRARLIVRWGTDAD